MSKKNIEWAKWIPISILAIALIVIYKTVDNLSGITSAIGRLLGVLSPFLIGILIVYFLYVPFHALEKRFARSRRRFLSKRSRGISIIIVYIVLIAAIYLLITFAVPILISSLIDMASSLPTFRDTILEYFNSLPADSVFRYFNINTVLTEVFNDLASQTLNPARIAQFSRSIITVAVSLFNVIISLAVSLYVLMYLKQIAAYSKRLSNALFKKDKTRLRVERTFAQINKVLFTFIASKGIDSIINVIAVTSILLLFKVKYAFLLGFLAGMLNFIPYLGSLIAVILICLITLLTGGIPKMLEVLIPLFIFQQLDGNFIEPKIMGNTLKINPLLVILSVVVGGAYFGIVGMFLAVPIAAIIKQVIGEHITHVENERLAEGYPDEHPADDRPANDEPELRP